MATSSTRPPTTSPVSAEEVAATRRPLIEANTLPARVYHDPEVFQFEVNAWFRKEWLFVCRHRGAMIVQDDAGQVGGFSCPYHAWTYDLQGNLRQPKNTETLANFTC